ncbi:HEAT repeat domain-containing protein [Planctomicrobium piriforme]|uniref:HEAT repeat-containing protein n=1 Tax=Planctomicrobium piriforme TaxID=1576369 RepID=A0A1I3JBJ0_9PLAN|nr:HEAT repeat domain-containing protein [Planctomicrobium piriforme]SFI57500.1 hypothetical protein SAMN05421753_110119 [Planctomicrobium piriforme]
MQVRFASRVQAWSCVCLLVWTTGAFAQDDAAPPGPPPGDPLFVKPTTVPENFDAALLMVKLARLDLAKYYLEQTLALEPSDEDMMALRTAHGTGTFLELTRLKELNPPATTLLDRLTAAVQNQISQPGYADGLIAKLGGSARERAEALTELRHMGPYAVPPILKHLDGDLGVGRDTLAVTLTRLGTEAIPPLIGALASPNEEVRAVAADVLGKVGSESNMLWLWYPAFAEGQPAGTRGAARIALARLRYGDGQAVNRLSSDGAVKSMLAAATQHLDGSYQWPQLYEEMTEIPVWTWSVEAGTVVEHPVPRAQASLFLAERLAREATLLAPDSGQPPVVLLTALLMRAVEQNGWKTPLPAGPDSALDLAVRCGPDVCERVLQYALDHKLIGAQLAVLEALALNGSPHLLLAKQGHSAVTDALDAPEARVQFAAATTILRWEPTQPFRNSRRVVEILARALNTEAMASSVVMDPNVSRAQQTASLFTELGFPATLASTGMDGFKLAAEQGNITLAVLHPNVIRWELSQTVANLRADARTANIPVVIYGPKGIRDRYVDFASHYHNVLFLDEGTDAAQLSRTLQPFLVQLSPPTMTPDQRLNQMREASAWLRRIAVRNIANVFDLEPAEPALTNAIFNPDVAEDALITLGAIGRPNVQNELFNVANSTTISSPLRQLAAYQLAFHIQRFGLLLMPKVAETIPGIWQNETDPQVRIALASVIGTLKPTLAAARQEILSQPASPAPVTSGPESAPEIQ